MTHTDTHDHDPDTEAGQADADQAQAVERLLDASGEAQAREALTAAGNRAGLQHLDRIVARRRAAELLKQGQPQPAVREQLMSERGLSRRTAYRVIEAAAALLGLRNTTTTDPQPESPTMSHTEATHEAEAAADATTDSTTDPSAPQHAAAAQAPESVEFVGPPRPDVAQQVATQPSPSASPLKVRVTHLHAPWPEGTRPGHVVEFTAGAVPSWAAGKCAMVDPTTPADFVSEPPSQATHVRTAPALWTVAPPDAESVADYAAQLAEVRGKVAKLSEQLTPAQARRAAATREVERLDAARGAGASLGSGELADVPDLMTWRRRMDEARVEQDRADSTALNLQRRMDELLATEQRLVRITTAAERLPAALQAQAQAFERVQVAQAEVDRMQTAIGRIDAELRTEEAAQAELKRTAAAELLERARNGQSLDDVATPNEGRLNALREARAGAVEALAAANVKANAERDKLAQQARVVAGVEADRLVADFEHAYRRTVEAATAWAVAHYRAVNELPALPTLTADVRQGFDAALETQRRGRPQASLTASQA